MGSCVSHQGTGYACRGQAFVPARCRLKGYVEWSPRCRALPPRVGMWRIRRVAARGRLDLQCTSGSTEPTCTRCPHQAPQEAKLATSPWISRPKAHPP
eukprot:333999-Pyramimonas_sp.AAC.1